MKLNAYPVGTAPANGVDATLSAPVRTGWKLQWGDDNGATANDQQLAITGVTGTLHSVEWVVRSDATLYNTSRYLFDIRRAGATDSSDAGGAGYFLQTGSTGTNTTGVSGFTKNGESVSALTLFNDYVSGDRLKFDVNQSPSNGAFSFGGRYNEVEHFYFLAISELTVVDDAGAHLIDMDTAGGSGNSLTSDTGNITATLVNFPTDDSQWVEYQVAAPTPVNLAVSGIESDRATVSWERG